ncbi:hypothetical protein AVEN_133222-1 [Araneus ventricosus]|uniref:Uncharacterized protein n=1 Tax=Araneus ventricosus TaxID=182803 RepID=A0A4Y2BPN5_ARAVE|nr:hypothetical protein AVEN_133222-1 [Araneus ventricosus]
MEPEPHWAIFCEIAGRRSPPKIARRTLARFRNPSSGGAIMLCEECYCSGLASFSVCRAGCHPRDSLRHSFTSSVSAVFAFSPHDRSLECDDSTPSYCRSYFKGVLPMT